MISLPIDAVLPALRQALENRDEAVLEAPPGAGKTTRVPLALLNEPWLAGQSILMLEPAAWQRGLRPSAWPASWAKRSARPWAIASAWTARSGRKPASR